MNINKNRCKKNFLTHLTRLASRATLSVCGEGFREVKQLMHYSECHFPPLHLWRGAGGEETK